METFFCCFSMETFF